MIRPGYYNRQGAPISLSEWAALLQGDQAGRYRIVKRTNFPDGGYLSTVWLGIDHNWTPSGPPLIFETMRFDAKGQTCDFPIPGCRNDVTDQLRYSTEAEALESHNRILALFERESPCP